MATMEWKWRKNGTLYLPPPTRTMSALYHWSDKQQRVEYAISHHKIQNSRSNKNKAGNQTSQLVPYEPFNQQNINGQHETQSTPSLQQNTNLHQFERLKQLGDGSSPFSPTPTPSSQSEKEADFLFDHTSQFIHNTCNKSSRKKRSGKGHHQEWWNIVRSPIDSSVSLSTHVKENNEHCVFHLREQPDEIQRKSYGNENRCLHPNPLVIYSQEVFRAKITNGICSVLLVDCDGKELPQHKASTLESINGGLSHPLENGGASFSLKILQTSRGQTFRLRFTLRYCLRGEGRIEEKILSQPFSVHSNKYNIQSPRKIVKTS